MPHRTVRQALKDLPERTDVERNEYTFEWEPAPAAPAAGGDK